MALLFNRAKMNTSTTGTGTITLGTAEDGFQTFADAGVSNADVVQYVIEDGSAWEIGEGTYTASGTLLARTTILESSNADAAINLSGSALVFITATAESFQDTKQISIRLSDTATDIAPASWSDLPIDGTVTGDSTDYTVETVGDTIAVPVNGWYRVTAMLVGTSVNQRASAQARILIDGTPIDGIYGSPYIRNSTSLDTDALVILSPWIELTTGQTITIQTQSGQGVAEAVTMVANASYLAVEQKGGVGPQGVKGDKGDAGDLTLDGNSNLSLPEEVQATVFIETSAPALSGTTPTVDCDEGNYFSLSTTGNTTFTFSYAGVNLTTNDVYSFTLKITAGGTHTLTWPAAVDWPGGTAPDAPASGETDVYTFWTPDGGTTWYGALAMDAVA